MTYVEWLRVGRCLKWTAIALVACVALVLYARFGFANLITHEPTYLEIHGMSFKQFERTAQTTHSVLADGTKRTVFSNVRQGVSVTVDDRGYWGQRVTVVDRDPTQTFRARNFSFGDLNVRRTILPNGTLIFSIDSSRPEHLAYYFAAAAFVALIVATVLGAPFARENEGHLEIALTKPVRRETLGLATMATDVAGMAAAFVLTIVFFTIGHTIFEAPRYVFDAGDALVLAGGFLAAVGWYALLCAATASMRRAYGVILGLSWPVAALISIFASSNFGASPVARVLHAIATPIAWVLPFSYLHFDAAFDVSAETHAAGAGLSSLQDLPILLALVLIYGAVAIVTWRRVEA
ncbi:MAG TPA: hypothetical protein VMF61_09550 [Candidatus Acidoferrales bacterium]|nr:hypothetical protein [Candidatus Acidoferrales bacterium]